MLSTDANFRLDGRLVSSTERDPGLGTGFSYFVEDHSYNEWVLQHADQEELSTCAGFAALLKANLKRTKGLRSSGVGAVVCVHDQWRPNGIGDLQKGERYVLLDQSFTGSTDCLTDTVTWTSFGCRPSVTTETRRFLRPMTLCVSGRRTFLVELRMHPHSCGETLT